MSADPWRDAWPRALETWSWYTQLREPLLLDTRASAKKHKMDGQLAAIHLQDQTILVNTLHVDKLGLSDHALPLLAHEIGHHIYVPGNLRDHALAMASIRLALVGLPPATMRMTANLYADLLINDRLQRHAGLDMAGIYVKLKDRSPPSRVWRLYMRTYEHLWRLSRGTLIDPVHEPKNTDADAMLCARLVRSFAKRWVQGAGRYASVLFEYLLQDQHDQAAQPQTQLGLNDTDGAASGLSGAPLEVPRGLTEVDPTEGMLDGFDTLESPAEAPTEEPDQHSAQQSTRLPNDYAELMEILGLPLDRHALITAYYREKALPHLIPFPSEQRQQVTDPLPEGTEPWSPGDPIAQLDVFSSLVNSPIVIPGLTTVQRTYGIDAGSEPERVPMDLDIYVDCSGSMPDPGQQLSYLTLAATILAMSALRAGARVQATLWSSPGRVETTGDFIRDEKRVLGTVTGFVSGGTAFPLHILRDSSAKRRPSDPPAHIVVISDDGCDTMLSPDSHDKPGIEICAAAMEQARGGGTLVLNLWQGTNWPAWKPLEEVGFHIHVVREWAELIAFARAFVQRVYAPLEQRGGTGT